MERVLKSSTNRRLDCLFPSHGQRQTHTTIDVHLGRALGASPSH